MSLSVFRDTDQEKAQKELECSRYLLQGANEAINSNNFVRATAYLENAIRSLEELHNMKVAKEKDDLVSEVLQKVGEDAIEQIARRYLV